MKVEISDAAGSKKEMKVIVSKDEVKSVTDDIYKDIAKEVAIKGFRKGKAPRNVIRMYYADYIKGELSKRLVNDKFEQAAKEQGLLVVSMPEIKNDPPKEDEDFEFTAKFDVKPEVVPEKYTGFDLKKAKTEIDDENVNHVLLKLQETYAMVEDVDDPEYVILEGDYVIVNVTCPDNERLNRENMTIEAGVRSVYPGLENEVVGLKVGQEKNVEVEFPQDHFLEDMREKKENVDFVVSKIKHKELPEVNDEFAKMVQQEVEDLDELKEKIREDLVQRVEADSRTALESQVKDELIKANPFDIPDSMIQFQAYLMIQGMSQRLASQGVSMEDYYPDSESLRADTLESAEKIVRSSLLIESIAKANDIEVNDEDIENELSVLADRYNVTPESVQKGLEERDGMEEIKFGILEKKVFDHIISNSQVTEVDKIEETSDAASTDSSGADE